METGREHRLTRQARREQRNFEREQRLSRQWTEISAKTSEKIRSAGVNNPGMVSSASLTRTKPARALDSAQSQNWYLVSPGSPSDQSRRLLQAIWDLSWDRWDERAK